MNSEKKKKKKRSEKYPADMMKMLEGDEKKNQHKFRYAYIASRPRVNTLRTTGWKRLHYKKLQYIQKDKWLKLWHLTPQREGNSLNSYRSTCGFLVNFMFFIERVHPLSFKNAK